MPLPTFLLKLFKNVLTERFFKHDAPSAIASNAIDFRQKMESISDASGVHQTATGHAGLFANQLLEHANVGLKPFAQTEQRNLPVSFIAVLLQHGFNGASQFRRNAYGAMILQMRRKRSANGMPLAVLGSYYLAKELVNGIKSVQWKEGKIGS